MNIIKRQHFDLSNLRLKDLIKTDRHTYEVTAIEVTNCESDVVLKLVMYEDCQHKIGR